MQMFREIAVEVVIGSKIVFRFAEPMSVETLDVANAFEDVLWDIIAAEFRSVPVLHASFRTWPINDAPPEMLALLKEVQERHDRELAAEGPRKPPLSAITYGELPAGYREDSPAKVLVSGEYNVLFFAEQGRGSSRFIIR